MKCGFCVVVDHNCKSIGTSCMIGASSLALVSERVQGQSLGTRGSLANGERYKTVRHKMDSETEEEFLDCILGISSN